MNVNLVKKIVKHFSKKAREKRAVIFGNSFVFDENTKILDLGSERGSNIHMILKGLPVKPGNIYIADINEKAINEGAKAYGFVPLLIDEESLLSFTDGYFDIVYCSSVIEHVTIPKEQVWEMRSGSEFREKSLVRQDVFSKEIQRLGQQYFVQTPYKYFPVESHTWLPFVSFLPRRLLVPILSFTNLFWVKKTTPDWNLLTKVEMSSMFAGAKIVEEKFLGFTKSIMAIKSSK